MPALLLFVLGVLLLLGPALVRWREVWLAWLWWLIRPLWWLLAVAGLAGTVALAFLLHKFWPLVCLLDAGTGRSIWGFQFLAVAVPVALALGVAVLFTLHMWSNPNWRRRVARYAGATAVVLAVLAAVSFWPFLSGRGAGVELGPVPEGTPINTLASIDPAASREAKLEARGALADFFLRHKGAAGGSAEERAAHGLRADGRPGAAPREQVPGLRDRPRARLRVHPPAERPRERGTERATEDVLSRRGRATRRARSLQPGTHP